MYKFTVVCFIVVIAFAVVSAADTQKPPPPHGTFNLQPNGQPAPTRPNTGSAAVPASSGRRGREAAEKPKPVNPIAPIRPLPAQIQPAQTQQNANQRRARDTVNPQGNPQPQYTYQPVARPGLKPGAASRDVPKHAVNRPQN